MTYDPSAELRHFGRWRSERVLALADAGEPDRIHGTLILAMGSRETNLRNILGGGAFVNSVWVPDNRDRGVLQISDRFHSAWLASVPGCDSGSWEAKYDSSAPPGRVPRLTDSVNKAIAMLRHSAQAAQGYGIPEQDCIRVAVAAYNCGTHPAIRGYQAGDVDQSTTGGNYSADVLERQRAIRRWLKQRGWGLPD